ncbi:hypothetical protein GLYMA_02G230432v4 [Glycine max]|nr:hypothetical protein GLYMA_02G230432v4 [Glycine max]KAH1061693.1 hypothetical protein GYH30_004935 [Glycine max]
MQLANENNDVQFVDFLESEFLVGQVEDIKKISEYVAQLRRMGRGHGSSSSPKRRCSEQFSARVTNPVYGCVGIISYLESQVSELQKQLAVAQAEILSMQM